MPDVVKKISNMEQFNTYFASISWQLCMDMRSGSSFAESPSRIMKDMDRLTEHMSRDVPIKDNPKKQANPPVFNQKGPKGYGKNSKSGPSYRAQPYKQQWTQRTSQQDQWYNKNDWYNRETKNDQTNKQVWKNSPTK